ncbi:MAG: hypothetical protein ACRDO1_21660 [Nocardioidaceae bacterium]
MTEPQIEVDTDTDTGDGAGDGAAEQEHLREHPPLEADPADAAEQDREVDIGDEDDYR